jgi:hypothetical protein
VSKADGAIIHLIQQAHRSMASRSRKHGIDLRIPEGLLEVF